jgi:hypothetical protein
MSTFQHVCIKPECSNTYEDKDPDAYYCKSCDEQNKALAKSVDARLKNRPKKPHKSGLQEYDETPKVHGFVHVKL